MYAMGAKLPSLTWPIMTMTGNQKAAADRLRAATERCYSSHCSSWKKTFGSNWLGVLRAFPLGSTIRFKYLADFPRGSARPCYHGATIDANLGGLGAAQIHQSDKSRDRPSHRGVAVERVPPAARIYHPPATTSVLVDDRPSITRGRQCPLRMQRSANVLEP